MKYLPFKSVITDVTSKFKKIKQSQYKQTGRFFIIDQGKSHIAGYTDEEELVNFKLSPIIVFGDHTKVFKYERSPIALGADGAKALWVNPKVAYDLYVYFFLKSYKLKDAGYSRHFKFLKEVKLPIPYKDDKPAINDQIRIATLLSRVETLIATRKENLCLLDEFLKGTFMEMFGDPVQNDRGWDKPELKNNFGEISTGNTPPRSNPDNYSPPFIEWIKTDNIDQNKMYLTPASEYLSETGVKKARIVKKGALLVACIAGSIESIGRAALCDRNVAFNQQINAIQSNPDINPIFLYWLFRISKLYIQSFAPKGMKKILTKGNFEKITMIKPPKDMQDHFASIVEKAETLNSLYQENLIELENLYGVLCQKAFKGELDLSKISLEQANEPRMEVNGHESESEPPLFGPLDPGAMSDPATRVRLLRGIVENYFGGQPRRFFSFKDFWARIEFNVLDHMDDESPPLGVGDYNQIKEWLFDRLKSGQIEQHFNEDENQMELYTKP